MPSTERADAASCMLGAGPSMSSAVIVCEPLQASLVPGSSTVAALRLNAVVLLLVTHVRLLAPMSGGVLSARLRRRTLPMLAALTLNVTVPPAWGRRQIKGF